MKLLYLTIILCALLYVNDVKSKIILIADKKDNNYNVKCVSSNYSEVLVPVFPLSAVPRDLGFKGPYKKLYHFERLNYINSSINHLGIVLDERWELFPIEHTIGNPLSGINILTKTIATLDPNNNRFGLSILAAFEAHIYICQYGDGIFTGQYRYCYWILLGGWSGKKSALRYCDYRDIPTQLQDELVLFDCRILHDEIDNNPLSESQWQHFEFSFDPESHRFSVYKNADTNPYLTTNFYDPIYPITSLTEVIISSRFTNVYWKFHNYDYWKLSTLNSMTLEPENAAICVSFFVYVKNSITLLLTLEDKENKKILKRQSFSVTQNQWTKISFTHFNLTDYKYVIFAIKKPINNKQVYLSRMENHKNCFAREYRYIEFQIESKFTNVGCTTLRNDETVYLQNTSVTNDFRCKDRDCISCIDLFPNNKHCNKTSFVCEFVNFENKCYCNRGSTGDYCEKECLPGRFGVNCQEKCDKCKKKICDNVNGACKEGCAGNYVAPECKEVLNPYLENPPKIVGDCLPSACHITINGKQKGKNERAYFKIKYKEQGNRHIAWMVFHVRNLTFSIEGLQIGKTYDLVVLICTYNNTCYDGDEVPKLAILNVTCHAPKQSDFRIEPNSNSALYYKVDDSMDACSLDKYYYEVTNLSEMGLTTKESLNLRNLIPKLKPATNYNIAIKVNATNKELFTISFSTKEKGPGPIQNFTANATDTKIYISWQKPQITNGIIKLYSITYENVGGVDCKSQTNEGRMNSVNVTEREYVFSNLMYYKTYKIVVTAYTIEKGESMIYYVNTAPSDQLDRNNFAIQLVNITSTRVFLNITRNCNRITSKVALMATATCSNRWCENRIVQQINTDAESIGDLYAYSMYAITVRAINLNFNTSIQIYEENFQTLPSKPNNVMFFDYYSSSANMLKFRWTEPYPPTGHLRKFRITYRRQGVKFVGSVDFAVGEMIKCIIWENMFCADIQDLNSNTYYEFEISSQNFEPNQFSNITTISNVSTSTEQPEKPQNIIYKWDDFYNLALEWKHPNRTYGELKLFKIVINQDTFTHLVKRPQLTYRKTFPISNLGDFLNISIFSNNGIDSSPNNITITTPPPTPVCDSTPTATFSNNIIIVNIPFINNLVDQNALYVIVAQGSFQFNSNFAKYFLDNYKSFNETNKIWVAIEDTYLKANHTYSYIIGQNTMNESKLLNTTIYNHKLNVNVCYNVYVYISNSKNNEERFKLYTIDNCSQNSNYNIWIVAVLLVATLIGAVIIYFIRKKPKLFNIKERVTSVYYSTIPERLSDILPLANNMSASVPTSASFKEEPELTHSKPIKICELENYIKDAIENGELEKQHSLLPRYIPKHLNSGIVPENFNVYQNLIPYSSHEFESTYIKGLNDEVAYITTSVPTQQTVVDFWKMIWNENVECIIMLTNILENGKNTKEKYWPNINECIEFDGIKIELLTSAVFCNYKKRVFKATHNNRHRKIEQLKFTMWPHHGVPLYTQSLVPFIHQMLKFSHGRYPIVLHCSTGISHTGTIILIDQSLRMASQKGYVDILYSHYHLREQRADMINDIWQYRLVHLVIMECLLSPKTAIDCDNKFEENLRATISKDGNICNQMIYVKDSAWKEEAITGRVKVPQTTYPEKNRFQNIVPQTYGLVYLTSNCIDSSSSYINAVLVDAYQVQQKYIATQQPLPNTVGDFWRMIVEYESSIVVSLQQIFLEDNTHCNFWPINVDKPLKIGDITLEYVSMETCEHFDIITVHVVHNHVGKKVKILYCNNWIYNKSHPESPTIILEIWEKMCKLSRNSHPIVITCRDGATGCGLYIATCFILEKMKLEQICDVCQAIRVIRKSRKQFVASKVQFIFLYKIALAYYNQFVTYSNFT